MCLCSASAGVPAHRHNSGTDFASSKCRLGKTCTQTRKCKHLHRAEGGPHSLHNVLSFLGAWKGLVLDFGESRSRDAAERLTRSKEYAMQALARPCRRCSSSLKRSCWYPHSRLSYQAAVRLKNCAWDNLRGMNTEHPRPRESTQHLF
jgi:hypothetical protein